MKKFINEMLRHKVSIIDYDYIRNFENARINNIRFGLAAESFDFDNNFQFDRETILRYIHENIFCRKVEDIALKCFPICKEISENMFLELGIKTIPTLGYLIRKNEKGKIKKEFYEHKYFLRKRIDRNNNYSINLHCWLTFQNLYILDPTITSTEIIAKKEFYRNYKLSFLLDGNHQCKNSLFAYQPIFIGLEYYNRLNLKGRLNII